MERKTDAGQWAIWGWRVNNPNIDRLDPDQIAHRLDELGRDFADKDSAFRALDELTKTVLAEIKLDYATAERSDAARECRALASKGYKDHLAALAAARREANRAKAALETYRAWVDLKRTVAATDRALMGLGR